MYVPVLITSQIQLEVNVQLHQHTHTQTLNHTDEACLEEGQTQLQIDWLLIS